jgi:hypothetical protein
MDWLGAPAFVGKLSTFKAQQHHADEATRFRAKRSIELEQALMSGTWDRTSELFIDNQIARSLQPGSRKSRKTALTQFYAFLKATDRQQMWATPPMEAKTMLLQRSEEEILAKFALTRFIAGDRNSTVSGKISQVRTAYKDNHFTAFGKGGVGTSSYTSRFIKSMQRFFHTNDKKAGFKRDRLPLMDQHLLLVYNYCEWKGKLGQQAALLTAFEGLFRMGELCPRDKTFKPNRHLCEDDIEFFPNFKDATHIRLFMGPSKADQDAKKAKTIPRTLLVRNDGTMSAGQCIKNMLIDRYKLSGNEEDFIPTPTAPLFQKSDGKHMRAGHIETVIKNGLTQGGVKHVEKYNTHSLRIGGTTRLCQLGCPIRLIKLFGGWSSNCVLIYIQDEAKSIQKFTRKMTALA